jgi:hypothetical protein
MPTMTKNEAKIFHSYVDSSIHYLEFGSGKSTIYAASAPSVKTIDSVESSEKYIDENLRPNAVISNALSTGKLSFHIIDIGETKGWGHPRNGAKKHQWPDYSQSVFSKQSNHDLVLVDGLFRVACTLNCILNTPDTCTIMIHDFWSRPRYYVLLEFLETIGKIDMLGVFRKKKEIDSVKLQSLIKKHQYLPGDRPIAYRLTGWITNPSKRRSQRSVIVPSCSSR